jgi:hypothetical protein
VAKRKLAVERTAPAASIPMRASVRARSAPKKARREARPAQARRVDQAEARARSPQGERDDRRRAPSKRAAHAAQQALDVRSLRALPQR